MSKSRKNNDRKENLENYKKLRKYTNKLKNQLNQLNKMNNQTENQKPEIRQSPVWNSNDMMELSGSELKTILDFIEQSTTAFYAINAVMSRNIVNGRIKLKFDKLNPATQEYEALSPEEEAPYQEEVQKAIQVALAQAKNDVPKEPEVRNFDGPITAEEQKDLPKLDALVDAAGNEISSNKLRSV